MAKICPKCASVSDDGAAFCSTCGSKFTSGRSTCVKCGAPLNPGDRFCTSCGASQESVPTPPKGEDVTAYLKKGFDSLTTTINKMAGEEGEADIHFKDLVSGIPVRHTQEEKDTLFVCGTSATTPKESEMVAEWPKPWLYSRVLLMFAVVFAGLWIMVTQFENPNALPGTMFVGALIVPISVVIFFWEMNVPRNISIFDVISIFFVGGVFSLVVTLFLYGVFSVGELDYFGALMVGFVEEAGKIIVVAYYIYRKNVKYKLNGMLLGACVGAGFAVFETAGYAFNVFFAAWSYTGSFDYACSQMMDNLFLRGVLAVGGHVLWAAVAGFGLILAKGDGPLKWEHFWNMKFVQFFLLVVVLHGVWDMPITSIPWQLRLGALIGIIVVVALVLIGSGLKQVSQVAKKAKVEEQAKMGFGVIR